MKRLLPWFAAAAVAAVLSGARLGAQDVPARLAFVDSQALIAAHPAGRAANELRELAAIEIGEIRNRLDALQSKGRTSGLTNEESELFNVLLTTLETVQVRYAGDIARAAQPAIEAVNEAIRAVAQANGIAVVMDIDAAAESGLVVYAVEGLDLTETIAARLR
jgi:outer membrane protein